jgi:hypothetical protein
MNLRIITLVLALLMTSIRPMTQEKPDFSGTWVRDAATSADLPMRLFVEQTSASITIDRGITRATYRINVIRRESNVGEFAHVVQARWSGTSLVVEDSVYRPGPNAGSVPNLPSDPRENLVISGRTERWTLKSPQQLVIDVTIEKGTPCPEIAPGCWRVTTPEKFSATFRRETDTPASSSPSSAAPAIAPSTKGPELRGPSRDTATWWNTLAGTWTGTTAGATPERTVTVEFIASGTGLRTAVRMSDGFRGPGAARIISGTQTFLSDSGGQVALNGTLSSDARTITSELTVAFWNPKTVRLTLTKR